MDESYYDKIFLKEVKNYLKSKYNIPCDCEDISLMLDKLSKMIIDDPIYVYHYDSEYWADYIVEIYSRK